VPPCTQSGKTNRLGTPLKLWLRAKWCPLVKNCFQFQIMCPTSGCQEKCQRTKMDFAGLCFCEFTRCSCLFHDYWGRAHIDRTHFQSLNSKCFPNPPACSTNALCN